MMTLTQLKEENRIKGEKKIREAEMLMIFADATFSGGSRSTSSDAPHQITVENVESNRRKMKVIKASRKRLSVKLAKMKLERHELLDSIERLAIRVDQLIDFVGLPIAEADDPDS